MPKSKFGISCACLGIAIGGAMLIGIAVFLIFSGGNMGLELSTNVGNGGCVLVDSAFRDTQTLSDPDIAWNIIKKMHLKNIPKKERIDQIFSEAQKAHINPAILLAFWNAEQTFGNEYKAFSYGKFNGKDKGFENQLAGALGVINDAIENRGYYTQPEGENIWTRLLYNYVSAERKNSYNEFGYVSGGMENRIVFLRKLLPDGMIECAKTDVENLVSGQVANIPCKKQDVGSDCAYAATAMIISWATHGQENYTSSELHKKYSSTLIALNRETGYHWVQGNNYLNEIQTVINSLEQGKPVLFYSRLYRKEGEKLIISGQKRHVMVMVGYDTNDSSFIVHSSGPRDCATFKVTLQELRSAGPHEDFNYLYVYIK